MQQDSCETSWRKSSWLILPSIKKGSKKNDVTEMLQKMYNYEFTESQHKINRENDGMSQEDLKFM